MNLDKCGYVCDFAGRGGGSNGDGKKQGIRIMRF